MSLNWSAKDIAQWETVNTDENWPAIQNVIFYTMTVGIPRITASNHEEFLARVLKQNSAYGCSFEELRTMKETYSELLPKLVGLSTNASALTITAFNKRLLNAIQDRMERL